MDNRKALIVQKIASTLKERNISKRGLAKKMDKHYGTVGVWFKEDHNFTLETLFAIEKALDITLIEIPKQTSQS